ncbi:hypothetical protein Hanom_Chr13g01191571 [Helianthus anomalus]
MEFYNCLMRNINCFDGLSFFGILVKTLRSCVLLQDHYLNRLGCLLVWMDSHFFGILPS